MSVKYCNQVGHVLCTDCSHVDLLAVNFIDTIEMLIYSYLCVARSMGTMLTRNVLELILPSCLTSLALHLFSYVSAFLFCIKRQVQ